MKSGKIILGAAAAFVTVASGLAFKAAKFSGHRLHVQLTLASNSATVCKTCNATKFWLSGATSQTVKCQTGSGANVKNYAGFGAQHKTFFTAAKSSAKTLCTHPVNVVTTNS